MSKNASFWIRPARVDNNRPSRNDVTHHEYQRKSTPDEIVSGCPAVQYRIFELSECCHSGTNTYKNWLIANDGFRYYRVTSREGIVK